MRKYIERLESLKGMDPEIWTELDTFLTQYLRLRENGFGRVEIVMQHGKVNLIHYHESRTL